MALELRSLRDNGESGDRTGTIDAVRGASPGICGPSEDDALQRAAAAPNLAGRAAWTGFVPIGTRGSSCDTAEVASCQTVRGAF